jgi:hypothetical protein
MRSSSRRFSVTKDPNKTTASSSVAGVGLETVATLKT